MQTPLKCLIVEDEFKAREILEMYIKRMANDLTLTHYCETVSHAIDILKSEDIDLIFLDLQLSGPNGLNLFIEADSHRLTLPPIIVTSAFPDRILQSLEYQFSIAAQMPKPVGFPAFKQIIQQVVEKITASTPPHTPSVSEASKPNYLDINSTALGKQVKTRVQLGEVRYVKAENGGATFYVADKKVHVNWTFAEVEKQLEGRQSQFCRVHKSYILNNHFFREFRKAERELTLTTGEKLDVGEFYLRNLDTI